MEFSISESGSRQLNLKWMVCIKLGQAAEARAEPRGRSSCEPQFCVCRCERGSVTCQIQRMATLNPVITHREGQCLECFNLL